MPRDTPEYDDDGPQWSESQSDRGSESLSSESNFEDKRSIKVRRLDGKPTRFALENSGCPFDGVSQKMNVTDAAQEPASITGYNEKTVTRRFFFYTEREV